MNVPKEISFTKEGYEKLKREQGILFEERKEAVEHLKKAREMGDLSENGYYKAAKAKLSSIDHRLHRIHHLIRFGKISKPATNDTIQVGSTVTVMSEEQKRDFILVGEHEANPSENKISVRSPIGSAMLGKKKRDIFVIQTPRGVKTYQILSIGSA